MANKMVLGENPNGGQSSYAYNALGWLVEKNGVERVNDYTSSTQEVLIDGTDKFVYGLGLVSVEKPTAKIFVHLDRLGSVIAAGDENGYMVAHIKYDEWGSPTVLMAGLEANYTGHEWDQTLQIYYAKARFYDAGDRRFTAKDLDDGHLTNPMSLNAYLYCLNNPYLYVDPDGRVAVIADVLVNGKEEQWFLQETDGEIYFQIHNLTKAYGLKTNISVDSNGVVTITAGGNGSPDSFKIVYNSADKSITSAKFTRVQEGGTVTNIDISGHMRGTLIELDYFKKLMCDLRYSDVDITFDNPNKDINDIWDKVTIARIGTLHPAIRQTVVDFILDVQNKGINLRVADSYRTVAEQNVLYAQGRTTPGKVVTDVRGGSSYHNYGLAIDVYEIKNGQVVWDVLPQWVVDIGTGYGFEWGGYWTKPYDPPHFQMTFGYSTNDLLKKANQGDVDEKGYVKL